MKQYPIGIMLECFKKPFDESLRIAREIGADALQIGLFALDQPHAARMEALDRIKSNGLRVSAVCGDLGGHGFTRAEDNAAKIETSKRIMELALDFETNVVTTHIGVIPADRGGCYGVLSEACAALGRFGEQCGARFAIETGPETPEVLNDFLNQLQTKGIGVNFDPANLVMVTGADPIQGVYTLKDKIVHTHAKDGIMLKQTDAAVIYGIFADGGIEDFRMEEYFREVPLGQGNVNLPAWLAALSDIGYQGVVTVEREVGTDPVGDISMAVRYLKEQMQTAGEKR